MIRERDELVDDRSGFDVGEGPLLGFSLPEGARAHRFIKPLVRFGYGGTYIEVVIKRSDSEIVRKEISVEGPFTALRVQRQVKAMNRHNKAEESGDFDKVQSTNRGLRFLEKDRHHRLNYLD